MGYAVTIERRGRGRLRGGSRARARAHRSRHRSASKWDPRRDRARVRFAAFVSVSPPRGRSKNLRRALSPKPRSLSPARVRRGERSRPGESERAGWVGGSCPAGRSLCGEATCSTRRSDTAAFLLAICAHLSSQCILSSLERDT